jgi:hypothetical protein
MDAKAMRAIIQTETIDRRLKRCLDKFIGL